MKSLHIKIWELNYENEPILSRNYYIALQQCQFSYFILRVLINLIILLQQCQFHHKLVKRYSKIWFASFNKKYDKINRAELEFFNYEVDDFHRHRQARYHLFHMFLLLRPIFGFIDNIIFSVLQTTRCGTYCIYQFIHGKLLSIFIWL